jgi:hypothetical protein
MVRQNPAYRLIIHYKEQPPTSSDRRLFFFLTAYFTMRAMAAGRNWVCIALVFSLACTSAHRSSPRAPEPLPTTPTRPVEPVSDSSGQGPWAFAYATGVKTYTVHRAATVRRTDSVASREMTSTNATHEILTFEVTSAGTTVTAVIDSFNTAAQGPAGPAQPNQVPMQLSGLLAGGLLTISNDPGATDTCSQIQSILLTDLRNLVVPFPDSLTHGLSWKDSVSLKGCQVGIPTSIEITRSFVVVGEIPYDGQRVLEIARTDSAHMAGEGGLQQHHVLVHAAGTGTGSYYVNVSTGQIIRLSTDQVLDIEVATVRSKAQFRQTSTQEFLLTP